MVDVAVITINYNASEYTLNCLQSVLEKTSTGFSYKIVVVDNNSEENDYQNLLKNFPDDSRCELYRSPVNSGLGGGNMYGAERTDARYLLFLNNDALFMNDCIGILTKYMDENPDVGVCTAQNYDEHGALVPSFDHNKGLRRLLFGRGFLENRNPTRYPRRKTQYKEPIDVDWVNGAFLFFRSKAFQEIGGFDTNIFLYWEEMDLCHRLRTKDYRVQLIPQAKVLHYLGVTIGVSEEISRESYRSYLYVIRKNYGFVKYFLTKCYLLIVFLLKSKKWHLLSVLFSKDPMKHSLRKKQFAREDARRDQ